MKGTYKICVALSIYLCVSILFNYFGFAIFSQNTTLIIPDIFGYGLTLTIWSKIVESHYTWLEYLSQPSGGFYIFSFPFFVSILLSNFFNQFQISPSHIIVLIKILIQLLAFFGGYILTYDYLNRFYSAKNASTYLSAIIGGFFFGINPSYFIGDWGWPTIALGYASLPWIIFCFNKIIFDENWKYSIICAFIISFNTDEHMLWGGYILLLLLYSAFIFILRLIKEKKSNFSVRSLYGFISVMTFYFLFILPRLITKFYSVSAYQFSLTKAGADVPWMHASMPNMLRAMSHMDIPNIYTTIHPIFSTLNSLTPLTFLIPTFAFISLLLYRNNWITLFYSSLLIFSILPFYSGSPFKWLFYWFFFNTPVGPIFRTWRIPDAYIALSLTVLIVFSLYYIFEKLARKKHYIILLILGILFVFSVYSWPLLTGDVNNRLTPVKVPNEYYTANSFLSNQTGDFRVVYVPEFVYSYGANTNRKPFWSPKWGVIQEFLTFSSSKPTFWPTGSYGHYFDFTLSPFYHSLLTTYDTETLSHFLTFANVQYIVIHDDIPTISGDIKRYVQFLNKSSSFKLVYNERFIYIFQNLRNQPKITVPENIVLVDGGYRVVKKFYDTNDNNKTYAFIFIDLKMNSELITHAKYLLSDKPKEQVINDLIFTNSTSVSSRYTIFPYNYEPNYDPRNKWSRASYLDPHQAVWHPYVNWKDYAWDFVYMKGVVFTDNSEDTLVIPFELENENYVVLVKVLVNEKGGKIRFEIGNNTFDIKTSENYNGFYWEPIYLNVTGIAHSINIKNVKGFNAISAIYIIPNDAYTREIKNAENTLGNFRIISFNKSLFLNSSYEYGQTERKIDNLKFTKINPTLWKVQVNATQPFMLSFGESYDPLWVANINKNGQNVGTAESIPINSVINGFWIDQTGNIDITIEFKPQKWYYIGIVISGITFIICILYLILEFIRKNKHDKK